MSDDLPNSEVNTETRAADAGNPRRRKLLAAVIGAFAIGTIGYGAYWSVFLRHTRSRPTTPT